jgi:uncharacterized protein YcfL
MKHLFTLVVLAVALAGCGSGEQSMTQTDQDNLERLHKDGIGKVMAEDAAKKGQKAPATLANPDGGPGPAAQGP